MHSVSLLSIWGGREGIVNIPKISGTPLKRFQGFIKTDGSTGLFISTFVTVLFISNMEPMLV